MPCDHPATSIVVDPAGIAVCRECSADVVTPSTVRPQHPRRCWEHPAGTVPTRKEPT